MSTTEHDELEQRLAATTRWKGDPPGLWREALEATARGERRATKTGRLGPRFRIAALVAAGVVVIAAAWLLPSVVKTRDKASLSNLRQLGTPFSSAQVNGVGESGRVPPPMERLAERVNNDGVFDVEPGAVVGGSGHFPADALAGDRHVVRKATIELAADDVETAFLKATRIPSAAHGEFVESSSLSGSGDGARAHLTLRVAADRLSETLNELRGLGRVRSEELQGEDVTGQVVDLDARLRNEQRVETELLELLDSRAEAPLKDILEMRRQINEVRQSIERLTARRENVRRLVALATILVIIRPQDAPPEESETGLGRYFLDRMDLAWSAGLRFLADTLAGGLRVLLGGLVLWVLLAIAIVKWRQHRRQNAPNVANA